jgi:hypothetical protein
VGALDDFGLIVELTDGLAQFFRAEFAGFGDEDIMGRLRLAIGSRKVPRGRR